MTGFTDGAGAIRGTIGAWTVHAALQRNEFADEIHYNCEITVKATDYDLAFTTLLLETDLAPHSTSKLWTRIVNCPFHGLDATIIDVEDTLSRLHNDIGQAERHGNDPFPQQHELDDVRAQLAAVEHELLRPPTADDEPEAHEQTHGTNRPDHALDRDPSTAPSRPQLRTQPTSGEWGVS